MLHIKTGVIGYWHWSAGVTTVHLNLA